MDRFTFFEPRYNYRYTTDYIGIERKDHVAQVVFEADTLADVLDLIHVAYPRKIMPYQWNCSTRVYELIPFVHNPLEHNDNTHFTNAELDLIMYGLRLAIYHYRCQALDATDDKIFDYAASKRDACKAVRDRIKEMFSNNTAL